MSEAYNAECTITGVYKKEQHVDLAIRRLLDEGVSQERLSVMGRDFESNTRIAGFISKREMVLGGVRTGAIFGSLFGSLLGLLTGVGVLFVPFIGSIVAAGPIGATLLGAASGAIAGSAGAGLASILATLGMAEDKAAIYQSRLKAGDLLVIAEVPATRSKAIQQIMEHMGGEEIYVTNVALTGTRACVGRCTLVDDLSPEVRSRLSPDAQNVFIEHYNTIFEQTEDHTKAEQAAWEAIHREFEEDETGFWSKSKATVMV